MAKYVITDHHIRFTVCPLTRCKKFLHAYNKNRYKEIVSAYIQWVRYSPGLGRYVAEVIDEGRAAMILVVLSGKVVAAAA